MSPRNGSYGSISKDKDEEAVELLPTTTTTPEGEGGGGAEEAYIGTVDAGGSSRHSGSGSASWCVITYRNHRISCALAVAVVCLLSARYWHNNNDDIIDSVADGNEKTAGRLVHDVVPALSTVDPSSLGFRTATRSGLALPSDAWGERYLDGGKGEFTPLPTNEWYLNLLSHRAAKDPSSAGEIAHVYTIPYVLGVSPPRATMLPHNTKHGSNNSKQEQTTQTQTMAGIDLYVPIMKAGSSNMQMVYDAHNGVSLGAIVNDDDAHLAKTKDADGKTKASSAPTSYEVDPDVPLSPLGVSLRWKHVNMKTHVVRGMPYGTVRFGRDATGKDVLPTILAGNRVASILLDSDDAGNNNNMEGKPGKKKMMMCGSMTGEHVDQGADHVAAISKDGKAQTYTVERELILHLDQSDFTWIAFFSRPVRVRCFSDAMPKVSVPGADTEVQFRLDVVEVMTTGAMGKEEEEEEELVVRMALLDECTTGRGVIKAHCDNLKKLGYDTVSDKTKKSKEYLKVLREGAMLYPRSPSVGTEFPMEDGGGEEEQRATDVVFDWDAVPVRPEGARVAPREVVASVVAGSLGLRAENGGEDDNDNDDDDAFVMFALPHHLESLSTNAMGSEEAYDDSLCLHTFHGRTCLVRGSAWRMSVSHGAPQSFVADRPPAADAIPSIAEALREDVGFELSPNVLRGAADTYFPAKILAKMGRIIEINEELKSLKNSDGDEDTYDYPDASDGEIEDAVSAAADVALPTDEEVEALLDDLQRAVEIWLIPGGKEEGGAEAEFLYDASWGGFVNCGCKYTFKKGHEDNGSCNNTFPECPALADVNEDFGNGWYNDHHFHYGYHIYAAAIVAKHRPEWGREYYERILLYIRDVANPSAEDTDFPVFRQKDWYLGNSWAAGLMSMELSPHGREQESSSEAIAAWEGIALYGNVMMDVFTEDDEELDSARLVRNVGELLTAMEVSAANRFWHVWGSKNDEEGSTSVTSGNVNNNPHINTYPKKYTKPVVGMMHETMASFQTWFAPEDVVSYGIQLIPFTAVSERRDEPEWSSILYPVYAESCETANVANDNFCEDNGWSIVQAGLLAETGEINDALEMAAEIPSKVFKSEGGDGNSLSNTLWFIATRKQS